MTRFLSNKQVGAIVTAAELGDRLRSDHPEIADLFRKGHSYAMIITRLALQETYRVTQKVAYRAIYFTLHGYTSLPEDSDPVASFPGLLADAEAETLARFHYSLAGKKSGRKAVQHRTGIYAMDQQSLAAAHKRGLETQQREKRGIFGLSADELRKHGAQGATRAKELGAGVVHGATEEQRRV